MVLTENEQRFLQLISEKAAALDERAGRFEHQLHGIEDEMREIKKSLASMKQRLDMEEDNVCRIDQFCSEKDDMKRDLYGIAKKTAATEKSLSQLKKFL
ncbi:MAG TPA: hypothetical protein VFK44_08935 [Bacillales bacterium]|nr:hypothetical protein [Bacillales bacterium]